MVIGGLSLFHHRSKNLETENKLTKKGKLGRLKLLPVDHVKGSY